MPCKDDGYTVQATAQQCLTRWSQKHGTASIMNTDNGSSLTADLVEDFSDKTNYLIDFNCSPALTTHGPKVY